MGLENFGTISFTSEAKTDAFVSYLEQGKFMTTRCRSCNSVHFPPKMDCPSCRSSSAEWIEVPVDGTLLTFSTVYYGPSGFEDKAPYTLAIADFQGIHIFGTVSPDIPPDTLKAGMPVKLVPFSEGEKTGYEFRSISFPE